MTDTPAAPSPTTAPSRRTVLATAGLGAGALALAGCGTSPSDAAGQATDAAKGAVRDAIEKAAIPVGGGRVFADQKVVVTQPTAGEFKAFSAVCTHMACLVDRVADGTIDCPCHGSRYDIATGAVKAGPAPSPLPEKKVAVSGDGITVT
jgi:Rieske Fe-S protein